FRVCLVLSLATSAFAGYLHNRYGCGHGVAYSGLTGCAYAPARYAVAAPAVTRSFATSYHAAPAVATYATAPFARVATYHAAPVTRVATYATAPVARVASYHAAPVVTGTSTHTAPTCHTAPTVSTYATAPAVTKGAACHAVPVVATVAHAPAYAYDYGLGYCGYGHKLAIYDLSYGYGLGSFNSYKTLVESGTLF
ncbi:unnamed protein product, partial [Ixodes hexagonus]